MNAGTGAITRFHLPYPVAALYQRAFVQHQPGLRYAYLLRLGEGLVRFLVLLALGDCAASGAERERMAKWIGSLDNAGFGKLHGVLRSTVGWLSERGDTQIPELRGLLDDGWNTAIDFVIETRNRFAHDKYAVPDAQAKVELDALLGQLRVLLSRVEFLREYHLGTSHQPRRAGTGWFLNHWHGSRGQEEECPSVPLKATVALPENVVLLLDPRRGSAIVLSPFLHWLMERERGAMLWLAGLAKTPAGTIAEYAHPVLELRAELALPDPRDAAGAGVTLEAYLPVLAEWHAPLRFELDDASRAALSPDGAVPSGELPPQEGTAAPASLPRPRRPSARLHRWLLVGAVAVALSAAGITARLWPRGDDPSGVANPPVALRLIAFDGGRFKLGSETGDPDEAPVRDAEVKPFWLGEREVTVAEYARCAAAGACTPAASFEGCNAGHPDRDEHPINCVTWSQARAFARWAKGRLPTEAEWEYAARDGRAEQLYPGGKVPGCAEAITTGMNGECARHGTAPVGTATTRTERGLADLAGNVWEWTEDAYAPHPGEATTGARVARGGGWDGPVAHARTSNRGQFPPDRAYPFIGLRLARDR